ncbi:MAG: universal stress protein [Anaerolineae bacterium]|nr:universal stress protein [Anaerolineae bacterium]
MRFLYLVANKSLAVSVVAFARSLAQKTSASVTILYVAEKSRDLEVGKANLGEIWQNLWDVPIEVKLRQGDPMQEFLAEVRDEEYDFVLVESRRRQRYFPSRQRVLVEKLIKKSPISVMLVRHGNIKLEKILVCTGGQDFSLPVVKASAALAGAAGVGVTLFYVGHNIPKMYLGIGMKEETIADVMASNTPLSQHIAKSLKIFEEQGVKSDVDLCTGLVDEEIISHASSGDYDMIVMGGAERVKLIGVLMSDISHEVIHRAKSAVFLVK